MHSRLHSPTPIPFFLLLLIVAGCAGSATSRTLAPYRQAAKDRPDDARAHYDLGSAALNVERYAEARKAFLRCLDLTPDDLEARFKLVKSLDGLDRRGEVLPGLRAILEIDSTHIGVNEMLADRCYGIILTFEMIGQSEPPHRGQVMNARQKVLLNQFDIQHDQFPALCREAAATYERLCRLDPEEPRYWCGLGAVRNQQEDFRGAEKAYYTAQRLDPKYLQDDILNNTIFAYSRGNRKFVPPEPRIFFLTFGGETFVILP
jgi:tetratricopeptide (TPR) repeat protein